MFILDQCFERLLRNAYIIISISFVCFWMILTKLNRSTLEDNKFLINYLFEQLYII
jgi:hypothetical protein